VREQASEVDRGVGGNFKSVWGNLQTMTEKGEIFKNYHTKPVFWNQNYRKTS